ncbi:hypothetical protein Bbelb_184650 [Branchiostoma belcheri]|nr:hypothetical protein Bbelb_184650 [Branchiostoma belcheri]
MSRNVPLCKTVAPGSFSLGSRRPDNPPALPERRRTQGRMFDSKDGLSAGLTGNGSGCVRCHAGAGFEAARSVKGPSLIRPQSRAPPRFSIPLNGSRDTDEISRVVGKKRIPRCFETLWAIIHGSSPPDLSSLDRRESSQVRWCSVLSHPDESSSRVSLPFPTITRHSVPPSRLNPPGPLSPYVIRPGVTSPLPWRQQGAQHTHLMASLPDLQLSLALFNATWQQTDMPVPSIGPKLPVFVGKRMRARVL